MFELRAIIPVAGNGVRLKPITDKKPKALIEVAGKPVLGHILDNLSKSPVEELVLIVGHKKESIMKWVKQEYGDRFNLHFPIQKERLGLGHAIYCASDFLDNGPVLILLGDEVFTRSYSSMIDASEKNGDTVGAVGIKEVDTPQYYGMITLDNSNMIMEMIEKPKNFAGKKALAGVYYIKKGVHLISALEEIVNQSNHGREYQLTDALQLMVNRGDKLSTFDVGEWYDCGRLETLLHSNHRLLSDRHYIDESVDIVSSEITEPCYIGKESKLIESKIGPNVSIGSRVSIINCQVDNVIIESNTEIRKVDISHAIFSGKWVLSKENDRSI